MAEEFIAHATPSSLVSCAPWSSPGVVLAIMHAWRGLSRGFRPATALRRCLLAHARPSAPHTGPPAIRCQSAAKHAGAKEQSRGGGRSKAKGAGQGAAAAAGAAKRAGAGQDATWRLYGVRVAADVDPGKDDFSA